MEPKTNMSIHLILGGARSGKSAFAEKMASSHELPVTYIATAQVYDDEFRQRVAHHQARRPKHWRLVESPHFLSDALQANTIKTSSASKIARAEKCIIIDCLTLWLAQCICPDCAPPTGVSWVNEREKLLALLATIGDEIILVSNEVGMGIVPLGEINRQFQDEQGRLNQAIAAIADKVTFVAAGLPLKLKG
jgi:adenosylcobinamide kinase/adenosylcobinamide-phosphate guanylyltransferase